MWFLFLSLVIFILVLVGPFVCSGAEWSLSPGIDVSQEYDSNIFFTSHKKEDDFQTSLIPSVTVSGKSEKTEISMGSSFFFEKYFSHSELDVVNFENNIGITHQITPRLSISVSGNFKKDDILRTELKTAGLVGVRKKRYIYESDISSSYFITERLRLSVSGGGNLKEYPEGPYSDLNQWYAGTDAQYYIDSRNSMGVVLNYSDSNFKDTSTIKTFSGSLYWRYNISEKSYITLGIGAHTTKTEYRITTLKIYIDPSNPNIAYLIFVKEKETQETSGIIYNFALNHNWTERFSSAFDIIREHYNTVDARGVDHSYLRGRVTYRLTQNSAVGMNLSYDRNDYDDTKYAPEETVEYFKVKAYLTHKFTNRLVLITNLSHAHGRDEIGDKKYNRDRTKISVLFRYSYDRLFSTY